MNEWVGAYIQKIEQFQFFFESVQLSPHTFLKKGPLYKRKTKKKKVDLNDKCIHFFSIVNTLEKLNNTNSKLVYIRGRGTFLPITPKYIYLRRRYPLDLKGRKS